MIWGGLEVPIVPKKKEQEFQVSDGTLQNFQK